MGTTLPVLRRSAIEAASHCLYRYKKIWVDGVDDTSEYALRGIAFHAAANRYIKRLVDAQLPQDQDEAILAFQEAIGLIEKLPATLVPEVREVFDRWSEHFELDLQAYITSEEHQARNEQAFTPDLVYGKPDCLEIIDFKTFWSALTEQQAKADFQARWYVKNAQVEWPGFPLYRFTFSFVRLNKYVSVTFTPDELDGLNREVSAVTAMIRHAAEQNEWPATAGPSCGFCALQCPLVDSPITVPKRLSRDDAPKVGAWLLAAEQQVRSIKKALKAYCAANGPVDVNGVRWDNRPATSVSYPASAVVKELNLIDAVGGFDPVADTTDLTLSKSALKQTFKRFPVLEKRLESVAHSKDIYRFGARKPGEEEKEDE